MKNRFLPLLLVSACLPFAAVAAEDAAPAASAIKKKAAHTNPVAAEKLTEYARTAILGEKLFKRSLGGVCVCASGDVVVAGDDLVVVFDAAGKEKARHKVGFGAGAVTAAKDGTLYVADPGAKRVVKLDADGKPSLVFSDGLKSATGLAMNGDVLLVADSSSGCVHKFGADAKSLGVLGRKEGARRGSISTCCGILDVSVNSKGEVLVAELGAHRVTVLDMDGKRLATWGREGDKPADFCGCCNPVSVCAAGDAVVVSEKSIPRVKVYSADGSKLQAVIGLKDFAQGCSELDLAVGADGRIYATDEVRKAVLVFSPVK